MILWKTAPARHGTGPDGGPGALGKLYRFMPGPIAIHRGTNNQGRALAVVERGGDLSQNQRIGGKLKADPTSSQRFRRSLPIVNRDGDEGRAAGLLHRQVVRAGQRGRYVLRAGRLATPLHIGPGKFRRLRRPEIWLVQEHCARLLTSGNYQRRLIAVGGEDTAQRM